MLKTSQTHILPSLSSISIALESSSPEKSSEEAADMLKVLQDEWLPLLADWLLACLSQEKETTPGFLKGNLDIRLMQLCCKVVRSKIIHQHYDDLLKIVISCLEHSPFNWFAPGKSTNTNAVRLRLFKSLLEETRRTASNLNPLLKKIPAIAWLRKEVLSIIKGTPGLERFCYWNHPSHAPLSD